MTARRQSGVALAIVLWFLAGMSLLVSGITYLARVDTQMAQLHLARATAASAGDGAIQLMLAGFTRNEPSQAAPERSLAADFLVGKQPVSVVMIPSTGLIDLNTAPAPVLARLFAAAAHLPDAEAKSVAQNTVLWRQGSGSYQSADAAGRFYAPEDIFLVPGVTRALWDGIRDSVVVAERGRSGSAHGTSAAADSVTAVLETAGVATPGAPGLPEASGGDARLWRVDAMVDTGGRTWLRRKWAVFGDGGGGLLPWRFARTEAPRVMGGDRVGY